MIQASSDYSASVAALRATLREAWRPQERLGICDLAERYRLMPREVTATPGQYDASRTPWVREIMDRLHPDDPAQVVVYEAAAQAGAKSTIAENWVHAVMGWYPSRMLYVLDTDLNARDWAKDSLDTMIANSSILQQRVTGPRSRAKGETIQGKWFPGGRLRVVGAHSASALCRMAAQYVVMDECDRYKSNVGYEGNAVALVIARQTTFGDGRKAFIPSTPTEEGASEVHEWFLRGDQRHWWVPCPDCGELQPLEWRDETTKEFRLVWTPGHPDEAHYLCRHCGAAWEEADKTACLAVGEWRASRPDLGGGKITSYNLNALYAPIGTYSWAEMASDWEAATALAKTGNVEKLQSFVNIRLAQTFKRPGEALEAHLLRDNVEPDWGERIPEGVLCAVTGSDVHPYRRETMTLGIGPGWELWILDYAVSQASPVDRTGWHDLDTIRRYIWHTKDCRNLVARASCVDAGFQTQRVLEYCVPRFHEHVYAVMGTNGKGPIWPRQVSHSGRNKDRGHFWTVHVDTAKNDLWDHFQVRVPGPRYVHIPDRLLEMVPDFLEQLTNERRVRKPDGSWTWEKKASHLRNEVWDCLVYCLAAAHSLVLGGMRFDAPQSQRAVEVTRQTRHAGYVTARGGFAPAVGERAPEHDPEW